MDLKIDTNSVDKTILDRLREQNKPKSAAETRFVATATMPTPRFLPDAPAR